MGHSQLASLENMKSYIPQYLVQKNNVVLNVLGTALFAELFISIFQPFGSRRWLPEGPQNGLIYFALATAVVLLAMGIIAISRTIMYKYGKSHRISYLDYAVWILAEVIAMSMTYTVVVSLVYRLFPSIVEVSGQLDFLRVLGYSVLYTAFILFIPYTFFILYFSLVDSNRQLLLKSENTSATAAPEAQQAVVLNFFDEKNEFAISIREDNLFYVAAADNYVDLTYVNGGKIRHFLLRQSLKNIEEKFTDRGLIRCHRSYVVNIKKVKIVRRDDDGLTIDFDEQQLQPIPVSKTYSERLMKIIAEM